MLNLFTLHHRLIQFITKLNFAQHIAVNSLIRISQNISPDCQRRSSQPADTQPITINFRESIVLRNIESLAANFKSAPIQIQLNSSVT
jgi:hypothetical protein